MFLILAMELRQLLNVIIPKEKLFASPILERAITSTPWSPDYSIVARDMTTLSYPDLPLVVK